MSGAVDGIGHYSDAAGTGNIEDLIFAGFDLLARAALAVQRVAFLCFDIPAEWAWVMDSLGAWRLACGYPALNYSSLGHP